MLKHVSPEFVCAFLWVVLIALIFSYYDVPEMIKDLLKIFVYMY